MNNTQATESNTARGNAQSNAHPNALDKKTFWIGILGVIMTVLVAAHVLPENQAYAGETVDGRDYNLVTALTADGSEVLFVLDKRTGLIALLEWDAQTRSPALRDVKAVQSAFGG